MILQLVSLIPRSILCRWSTVLFIHPPFHSSVTTIITSCYHVFSQCCRSRPCRCCTPSRCMAALVRLQFLTPLINPAHSGFASGSESRMVRRAVPAAPAPAAVPPAQGAAGAVTTTTTSGSPPATVPGTAPKTDGASTGKSKQHKAPHPPRTYDQQVAHIKKLEAHLAKEKAKLAKMKQGTTTANSTPNVAGNPAVGVTPATPGAPNPGAKVQKRGHSGRKT